MLNLSHSGKTLCLIPLLVTALVCGRLSAQQLVPERTYRVSQIELSGNEHLTEEEILGQMNLHTGRFSTLGRPAEFHPRVLRLDVISIQNYYKQRGYRYCSVQDSFAVQEGRRVAVYLQISEERQYFLNRLQIDGNILLPDQEVYRYFNELKTGEPFNVFALDQAMGELSNRYKNEGKPFVTIEYRLEFHETGVDVLVDIEENQTVYIKEIQVQEPEHVQPSVLRREVLPQPGDRYNLSAIRESQRRIFETGLFADANIVTVSAGGDSQQVVLQVSTRPMDSRTIRFDFGAGQNQSPVSGEPYTTLESSLEWIHRNLLATGRQLSVLGAVRLNVNDFTLRPKASVSYTEPWIWQFRLPTTLRLLYDYDNYGLDYPIYRWGTDLTFQHTRRRELVARSTLKWQRVLLPEGTPLNEEIQRARMRNIEFLFRRDTRENYLYPRQGMVLELIPKVYGGWLGGTAHFFQAEVSISRYRRVFGDAVLAGRFKVGSQHLYGGMHGDIPEWMLFKLGGPASVRGFRENRLKTRVVSENGGTSRKAVGDQVKVMANLELRFPIYWQFGGEIFLDAGQLRSDYSQLDILSLRHTIGFGITFATPLGPVRLDYGRKIGKLEPHEQRWVPSLALQYAF